MTLGQKQRLFGRLLPRLLDKVLSLGLEYTTGDAFRDPRVYGELGRNPLTPGMYGHPSSAHKNKLAIDLNLFRNGRYLASTEAHRIVGEWWVKQHELARWGGTFGDGNHYSLEHGGVK